jgi:hypothetical protein
MHGIQSFSLIKLISKKTNTYQFLQKYFLHHFANIRLFKLIKNKQGHVFNETKKEPFWWPFLLIKNNFSIQ